MVSRLNDSATGFDEVKICISNGYGLPNTGDAILMRQTTSSIREVFPEAEISAIVRFPEMERIHDPDTDWQESPGMCRSKNIWRRRFFNGLYGGLTLLYAALGAPSRLAAFWPLPRSQLASIRNLQSADLVVLVGGGYLLEDSITVYSHLLQIHLVRRFNKPHVLAPQSIGPVRNRRLKRMLAKSLADARMIAVREQFSRDFAVKELRLPAERIVRTTDLAFEYEGMDAKGGTGALMELGIRPEERFIGATVLGSSFSFPFERNPARARALYKEKLTSLLKTLHERTRLRIVLFNQVHSDVSFADEVRAECGDFVLVDKIIRTPEVMCGMVERAEVMLGTKFHSCIIAFLMRVPFFCLSYVYKATGMMNDLGLSDLTASIETFEVETVLDAVENLMRNREAASRRMDEAAGKLSFPRFSDMLREVRAELDL